MAENPRDAVNERARADDWVRKWTPLVLVLLGWAYTLGYLTRGINVTETAVEHNSSALRAMELEHAAWRNTIIRISNMQDDVAEIKEALAEERGRRGGGGGD